MSRPIRAVIDTDAMRHNLELVRKHARGRRVWAVVKADAYGHTLEAAAAGFAAADGFAIVEVPEAERLRRLGWTKPLLLLEGFFDDGDLDALEQLDITTVVHSEWMIQALERRAPWHDLKVFVKLNSGMNRLGFAPAEYPRLAARLAAVPGCRVLGPVTHFANAERTPAPGCRVPVAAQLACLGPAAQAPGACLANSGATLFHDEVAGDALRAGIVLYGVSPDALVPAGQLGLEPVMSLQTEVIAIQDVPAGGSVGYGSRWTARRASRIAVVACGYADGYPRRMPDGAPVWVAGSLAPIAGAVSMDMITVDVTDVPAARPGSPVELWGRHVPVTELARLAGTIDYELLVHRACRVPVVVK